MQMGIFIEAGQHLFHRAFDANLIDVAHVVNIQPDFLDQTFFAGIDRTDSDLTQLFRTQHRAAAAETRQLVRPVSEQTRDRHAVDISGWRDRTGIEIRMRIEPHHHQPFADLAAVLRNRGDRTDGEAMIAPKHDRHALQFQLRRDRVHHRAIPRDDFRQMPVTLVRWLPRIDRAGQIAAVDDVQPVIDQRGGQAGDTQGFRPHRCTAMAGADIGGNAYQGNGWVIAHGRKSLGVESIRQPIPPVCTTQATARQHSRIVPLATSAEPDRSADKFCIHLGETAAISCFSMRIACAVSPLYCKPPSQVSGDCGCINSSSNRAISIRRLSTNSCAELRNAGAISRQSRKRSSSRCATSPRRK